MKKRLRWKRGSKEKGLAKVCAAPEGFEFHDGEKKYASVSPHGGGWRPLIGWYWVAGWGSGIPHMNSCDTPVSSIEEAKKQAEAYVKKHLSEAP
jgi:hypothetical protein